MNLNPQPIQLLSLFDPTQKPAIADGISQICQVQDHLDTRGSRMQLRNPNLQISGFDHKKGAAHITTAFSHCRCFYIDKLNQV